METLKKILKNQYFPAAAVLVAVILFWTIAMFGGLSLLHNNQPPMATLAWMLFVYAAAVLTPLAGVLAAMDLVRRWLQHRNAAPAFEDAVWLLDQAELAPEPRPSEAAGEERVSEAPDSGAPASGPKNEPLSRPNNQPLNQPLKKTAQARQRKKAA